MTSNDTEAELSAIRQQIDGLDDKLVGLLSERIGLVQKVGEYKRRTAPGICPIRPAREAEMIRRIMSLFDGSAFPAAAAAALWRTIIGASTSVEQPLIISVFAPDREEELFWLTREYFGPSVSIIRQPHIKRVIGEVMDGKANLGVVPMLRSDDTTFWWTNLLQEGSDIPKVFARIPFIYNSAPGRNTPSGLAFARLNPENSGQDNTLIAIEADANLSHSKLQITMTHANLEASWINIATLQPSIRHHLIELKGFITPANENFKTLLTSLGASVLKVSFLGSYAVPINLHESTSNDLRPSLGAATAAK